ncbi:MAG: hypothetical protein NVSMB70_15040 [Chamaesiphon sp.]
MFKKLPRTTEAIAALEKAPYLYPRQAQAEAALQELKPSS